MKIFHELFLLIICLAILSCTNEKQYYVKIITDKNEGEKFTPRIPIKASNDSLANVYGFRAFVAALNEFEKGPGNSGDLSSIDFGSMPRGFIVYNADEKDITNITNELFGEEMKNYVPSQLRLAAEKKERERLDSLALIAWGDAKFGMTQNEVRNTPQFRNMQKVKSYSENVCFAAPKSTTKKIREAFDLFVYDPSLQAEFGGKNYNELVEVNLESHEFRWDLYDYMVKDYKKIANYISQTYGPPEESHLEIERYTLESNDFRNIATWSIGQKHIFLYISSHRSNYKYLFSICNYDYPKTRNEDAINARKKEAQKKEELKADTF